MSSLTQDLRYALRTLIRTPAFTVVVVLTLGLGIGANTAIFSLMDQMLLRLLPVKNPAELVQLDGPGTFRGRTENERTFSYPMYADLRDRNGVFTGLVARYGTSATLTLRGQAERVDAEMVSGNTFDVLGVSAIVGRTLTADDDRTPGAHPVVMLSWSYWQRRFAGDPTILNQVVTINATPMTIVGIAPSGFAGVVSVQAPDIFVPLMMKAELTPTWKDLDDRQSRWVSIVGRLKPGLTTATAKPQLDVVYRQINEYEVVAVPGFAEASQAFKDRFRAKQLTLYPAGRGLSDVRSMVTTPLYVLMAMVGLVLLIACANVANLLLVRATARQREISLRTAFGAGRLRLVRLLLTESLALSLLGGATGTLLAIGGIQLLRNLRFHSSVGLAQLSLVKLDPGMLAITLALSVMTGVLFGLAPAWLASRSDLSESLKQGARGTTESGSRGRLRGALVVFEVAASFILLACAGLLLRSFVHLANFNPGFDPRPLAYVNVSLQGSRYQANTALEFDQKVAAFADTVLARFRALPGVESAGAALNLPAISVGDAGTNQSLSIAGRPEVPMGERPTIQRNSASHDYFETMGIPLRRGRTFTEHDHAHAPRVAVINETLARRFFGDEDPIGQRIRIDNFRWTGWSEIVGVVADTVQAYGQDRAPQVFEPFAQVPSTYIHVAVRTSGDPAAIVPSLKAQIHAVDPNLAVPWAQPMTQTIGAISTLARQRFISQLLGLFSAIALVIAVVGIYGVLAYSVSRRTAEFGIRVALGANAGDVLRLVLGQGARVVGLGLLLGLIGSIAAGRAIESMLYHTSASDPIVLVGVTLSFAAIGTLACWLPARRPMKVDPLTALRAD